MLRGLRLSTGTVRPSVVLRCCSSFSSSRLERLEGVVTDLTTALQRTDSSSITQENAAYTLCQLYSELNRKQKTEFLCRLSETDRLDLSQVRAAAENMVAAETLGPKIQEEMISSLSPSHHQTFRKIGQIRGGVKFLVDLRKDVLEAIKTSDPKSSEYAALKTMNGNLRNLLSNWFSVGFLTLQQVTWDSPCSLVEKICDYEAVHPIVNWTDIKTRVGANRRCFVLTHPSMPGEPVVILHVALTDGTIASSVDALVRGQDLPWSLHTENKETRRAAIFYSVTSTQAGLQGIELGTHLIKQAVTNLKSELPNVNTFSTLSPIPGFRAWLLVQLTKASRGEEEPLLESETTHLRTVFQGNTDIHEEIIRTLKTKDWSQQSQVVEVLKPVLMRLCARYLLLEKRRNFALNSVANFHLRNGSCLWRINWMADTSRRGLEYSCGMMVNYRYFLDRLENNSNNYIKTFSIDADQQVLELLE